MASSVEGLKRFDKGWRLPIDGLIVTQIRLDHAVTLLLEDFHFHDGTRVFVPASQEFEPWELAGLNV
jgi:hypothetical protein